MPTSEQQWTRQCDQVIASDAAAGQRLLADAVRQLERSHWSEHDIFSVRLAVGEALDNAVVHGNASDTNKHLRFVCRISPAKIRVEITDEGQGFDADRLPDPTSPGRLQCPGGRGVLLMRSFMSHVEFRDGGNHVVLEKERQKS
jgi:serine/threonine-protein kinase RsbW